MITLDVDLSNAGAVYAALGLFALIGNSEDEVLATFRPNSIEFSHRDGDYDADTIRRIVTRQILKIADVQIIKRKSRIMGIVVASFGICRMSAQ